MSRLEAVLAAARAERRVALMPYMMVGYPDLETSIELVKAMVAGGAEGIELGVAFSDPLADGPSIQRAAHAALQAGVTPRDAIDVVRRLRADGVAVPLILMEYCNSFLAYGEEAWISDAATAGADALIIVDLPPEESDSTLALCRKNGLDLIFFAAPTSDDGRIADMLPRASGFIYCVGVIGVTGARAQISAELPDFLRRLREKTNIPLTVGFGISKREHIEALRGLADAAIVASAFVDLIESSPREERVARVRNYVEVLTGRTEDMA